MKITKKKYIEEMLVRRGPPPDDDAFAEMIDNAFQFGLVDEAEYAHDLNMSRTSVTRHRLGISLPHPAMRGHIFKYLQKRISHA